MIRIFTYCISNEEQGESILSFLKSKGFSRHILSTMKQNGPCIFLNGHFSYASTKLKANDLLTVHLADWESSENILPIPLPLSILYEDEDILVVDKPADMPVHPSLGNYENTLANAVMYYYSQQNQTLVYRCINRLDRDTTGALILAKNALSAALLGQAMKRREIRRTYLAVTSNIPPKQGTITAPIGRRDGSAIERCVDHMNGEYACTHFKLLMTPKAGCGHYSLIQLNLDTGRTHQIRVHMKYLGYPLLGDYLYNPDFRYIKRQALHSYQLDFLHPITKKPMHITAPVPFDIADLLDKPLSL